MNIRKIVPVDFPAPSLDVVRQAAIVAHHFHSEIVMLHVVDMLAASDACWSKAIGYAIICAMPIPVLNV